MNNIFSLSRFLMLFKKHSIEKGKEYLLSIATLTILLFLILSFSAYASISGLREDIQILVFVLSFLLTGTIFTSMVFLDLSDKRKSTTYLILPASHLEKYLVNWVFSFIIFQIVFLAAFYSSASIVLSFDLNDIPQKNKIVDIFDLDNQLYFVFYVYLFLHSLMLCGAIYFTKKQFIKTVFSLFVFALSLTFLNKLLLSLMIKSKVLISTPFTQLRFIESQKQYFLDQENDGVFMLYLVVIITIVFWLSAYYRLKEKEV